MLLSNLYTIRLWCQAVSVLVGVDCVGTVSASILTFASIQALTPDLIINAGTAGGFKVWFFVLEIYFFGVSSFTPESLLELCRSSPLFY